MTGAGAGVYAGASSTGGCSGAAAEAPAAVAAPSCASAPHSSSPNATRRKARTGRPYTARSSQTAAPGGAAAAGHSEGRAAALSEGGVGGVASSGRGRGGFSNANGGGGRRRGSVGGGAAAGASHAVGEGGASRASASAVAAGAAVSAASQQSPSSLGAAHRVSASLASDPRVTSHLSLVRDLKAPVASDDLRAVSPRTTRWVERVHPVLEVYNYTKRDVVELVRRHEYKEDLIEVAVVRVIDENKGHELGDWVSVKNKTEEKLSRTLLKQQAAASHEQTRGGGRLGRRPNQTLPHRGGTGASGSQQQPRLRGRGEARRLASRVLFNLHTSPQRSLLHPRSLSVKDACRSDTVVCRQNSSAVGDGDGRFSRRSSFGGWRRRRGCRRANSDDCCQAGLSLPSRRRPRQQQRLGLKRGQGQRGLASGSRGRTRSSNRGGNLGAANVGCSAAPQKNSSRRRRCESAGCVRGISGEQSPAAAGLSTARSLRRCRCLSAFRRRRNQEGTRRGFAGTLWRRQKSICEKQQSGVCEETRFPFSGPRTAFTSASKSDRRRCFCCRLCEWKCVFRLRVAIANSGSHSPAPALGCAARDRSGGADGLLLELLYSNLLR